MIETRDEAQLRLGTFPVELTQGIPPRLAAYMFFSAIESILTGSVVGALPARLLDDEGVLGNQVVDIFLRGVQGDRSSAS